MIYQLRVWMQDEMLGGLYDCSEGQGHTAELLGVLTADWAVPEDRSGK